MTDLTVVIFVVGKKASAKKRILQSSKRAFTPTLPRQTQNVLAPMTQTQLSETMLLDGHKAPKFCRPLQLVENILQCSDQNLSPTKFIPDIQHRRGIPVLLASFATRFFTRMDNSSAIGLSPKRLILLRCELSVFAPLRSTESRQVDLIAKTRTCKDGLSRNLGLSVPTDQPVHRRGTSQTSAMEKQYSLFRRGPIPTRSRVDIERLCCEDWFIPSTRFGGRS
jgi:hypothetical protein